MIRKLLKRSLGRELLNILVFMFVISGCAPATYQPLTADQVVSNTFWLQSNKHPVYKKYFMLKHALLELNTGIDIQTTNSFVSDEEGTDLIKLYNLANYYIAAGRVAILELKFETANTLLKKASTYLVEGLKKIHKYAIRERNNSMLLLQKEEESTLPKDLKWNYL